MGTINPETLYNKIYADSPLKNNTVIMDEVTTKDFREFLQRTKPNFENSGDASEKELLESLSKLLHTKTDIDINSCKKACTDIQDNFCSSMCSKIGVQSPISSRAVIGGIFITLTAALIYKIRTIGTVYDSRKNNSNETNNNKNSDTEKTVHSDEDVVEAPRIVHIKQGWFW
jgi:hypothetical protein